MNELMEDIWNTVDKVTKVSGILNGVGIEFEIYSNPSVTYEPKRSVTTFVEDRRYTFTVEVEELGS